MRSERWTTKDEIKCGFHETAAPYAGAGPIVYTEGGRKWSDDSEAHIAVIGRTSMGKSQCGSLPFFRECLHAEESLIMLDPKGECYRSNSCFIPDNYQKFCIDLSNPGQSRGWNPLLMAYRLFKSDDTDENDIACSIVSELCDGIYPADPNADGFWKESASNYVKGLIYGLFEAVDEERINFDSVAAMMEQSEERFGAGTFLKEFYDLLPSDSIAKRCLAVYATAPHETRASIHSVASSGLEMFSRSRGLMEMLGSDDLNILELNVDRPFIITIITPDYSNVYDSLAGLLVSQLTRHLIRAAEQRGGRLPRRVNLILEELGSIGKSIPNLPNLMTAGRSRNMRLMLVLQSTSQLVDVYGKSRAETIKDSIGITIGFSTNSWEMLNEWSQRCGEKQTEICGHIVKEPLITAAQLAAMPRRTALIMVDNRYKFITHLPLYNEMYDNSAWKAPETSRAKRERTLKTVDFKELVKSIKSQQIKAEIEARQKMTPPEPQPRIPDLSGSRLGSSKKFSELMAAIDKKIEELDAQEAEKLKTQLESRTHVLIKINSADKAKLVRLIVFATGMTSEDAEGKLISHPINISFETRREAEEFAKAVGTLGCDAIIQ